MKYNNLTIGIVKNNADPMQNGRLQVYVPAYDSQNFQVDDLPWAIYVSPFGGVTANFKVGAEGEDLPGISAYGMWMIPKNGAQVLIGCIDGNAAMRFYVGCIFMPEHNRTLPLGIDGYQSDLDESGSYPQGEFGHIINRANEAGLGVESAHFKTRGPYERSVSHPSNKTTNKPTTNGYAPKPLEPEKADSQIFSVTTPGRHALIMSDVDDQCRIRFKTTHGSQIILDDTNERIYISTARGKNWLELDEGNGKIYIHSDAKIAIHAGNDLDLVADKNINILAKGRINMRSEEGSVAITGKLGVGVKATHADITLHASQAVKLKSFNGPKAASISERVEDKPPMNKEYTWAEMGGSTPGIMFDAPTIEVKGHTLLSGDVDINGGVFKLTVGHASFDQASTGWRSPASNGLRDSHNIPCTPTAGSSSAQHVNGHATLSFPSVEAPKRSGHPGSPIIPQHEPWPRDQDSTYSGNEPRNKRYQG
jgi:hypothetical protein